jgi:hypothetical protein
MINVDTMQACSSLAIKATGKDKRIIAVTGTPLASLVKATNLCLASSNVCAATDDVFSGSSVAYATGAESKLEETIHDKTMDDLVNDVSKAVATHISFAKNVVSPMVVKYIDYVVKQMSIDLNSAATKFSVEVIDLPEPLTNGSFEQSLERFKEKTFYEPEDKLKLGARTSEEIFALLQSGSKDFDAKVAVWYGTLSPRFIDDVWSQYFGTPSIVTTNDWGTSSLSLNSINNRDTSILVFLLAQRLGQDIPESTSMTLTQYRDTIYNLTEASALQILGIYDRHVLSIKTNTLVEFVSFDGRSIKVNGTVYRDWLAGGGSNEIILGMAASSSKARVVSEFTEKADSFKASWYQFEELNNTLARNNKYARFVQALETGFEYIQTGEQSEQERVLMQEKPTVSEEIKKYFKEELEKIKNADVENVNDTCMRLLCRSRYFYTDAEKFLTSINEAHKANPEVDVRVAALIATIEYVADYVADQMQVV